MTIKQKTVGAVLCALFFLSCLSLASAQPSAGYDEGGQEASTTQAQETLASLFGRGAKMPSIPHPKGTVALPAFDHSGMTIDEGALRQAEQMGSFSAEDR